MKQYLADSQNYSILAKTKLKKTMKLVSTLLVPRLVPIRLVIYNLRKITLVHHQNVSTNGNLSHFIKIWLTTYFNIITFSLQPFIWKPVDLIQIIRNQISAYPVRILNVYIQLIKMSNTFITTMTKFLS